MPPTPYGMDLADRYALGIDDYDYYVGLSSQLIAVDTAAAAKAYAALIGSPELRRRMGQAGREVCGEKFNLKKNVAQLVKIYAV